MPQVAQGGTIRLYANYRDGSGSLTDPTTPLVDMLDPLGSVIVNDAVPVRDSLGSYHYDFAADPLADIGDWTVRWTGTIAGNLQEGEETVSVVASGSVTPSDPRLLVSLADYKVAIRETNSANDAFHQSAIEAASAAILHYSDRDFAAPNVTETRPYQYNGSGVLNIDECTAITAVSFPSVPLVAGAWIAKTDGPAGVPYSWLELPVIDWGKSLQSLGAMGFNQNFDQYLLRGYFTEMTVSVTATFGWPTVPADIQRATIWTAESYEAANSSGGEGGDLSSKTVAEVTESYFQAQMQQVGMSDPPALPDRAKAIVDAYRRVSL